MSDYTYRDPSRYTGEPLLAPPVIPLARRINPDAMCGRGCCWTPFGVCPLERRCGCHRVHATAPTLHLVDYVADEYDEDGNLVEDLEALAAAA